VSPRDAREARRVVEAALDHAAHVVGGTRWPWNARLSKWLDVLLTLEAAGR
jgi:hypothetical protein